MAEWWNRTLAYANNNPVKFVAVSTFCTLGAVPLLAFLAYSVATLVASIVGAVVIELFLLAMGITGLAFVLFFVTCIAACATSAFAALYFGYQAANSTFRRGKEMRFHAPAWPFSSTTEPQPDDHQTSEADKKK